MATAAGVTTTSLSGLGADERAALLARYRHLVGERLPARAARERWVVRHDHCFARIVLDHAVGAAWKTVLTGREPAWRQLDAAALRSAVAVAEAIDAGGDAALRRLDAQSLAWRGKRPQGGAGAPR